MELSGNRKKANIKRVFKVGEKEDAGNYRSVNIISVSGRVTWQILVEAMYKHVKNKKVTWNTLHSFTKDKSCLTNSMTFYDEVTGLVDVGTAVAVYLDFSKAFGIISHSILIVKLAKCAPDRCTCMAELPGSNGDHQHKI